MSDVGAQMTNLKRLSCVEVKSRKKSRGLGILNQLPLDIKLEFLKLDLYFTAGQPADQQVLLSEILEAGFTQRCNSTVLNLYQVISSRQACLVIDCSISELAASASDQALTNNKSLKSRYHCFGCTKSRKTYKMLKIEDKETGFKILISVQ